MPCASRGSPAVRAIASRSDAAIGSFLPRRPDAAVSAMSGEAAAPVDGWGGSCVEKPSGLPVREADGGLVPAPIILNATTRAAMAGAVTHPRICPTSYRWR
jgi:hypothetical protein